MKKYYIYFNKYRNQLVLLAVFTVFGIFLDIVFPYINGNFIDSLVSEKDYTYILNSAIIIWVAGVMNLITKYLITCHTKKINEWCCFDIKKTMIHHFRSITILKYQSYSSAYLSKRIELDSSRIVSFFLDNYIVFFARMIQTLIIGIVLININVPITIGIIIIAPIYFIVIQHFKMKYWKVNLESF